MIVFKMHYIQNPETKKKCRVSYSLDNRADGRKCVTMYSKTCLDYMEGIIDYKNNTDSMTDYFESDRAVIFEDHPQYAEARKIAEKVKAKQNQRYYNRLASRYGKEYADKYVVL